MITNRELLLFDRNQKMRRRTGEIRFGRDGEVRNNGDPFRNAVREPAVRILQQNIARAGLMHDLVAEQEDAIEEEGINLLEADIEEGPVN